VPGVSEATETAIETTAPASAEEVVRAAFEAIGRRDLVALRPFYSPDVIEDVVPIGVMRGPDAVIAFFEETFGAVPDAEITVSRIVANGGREVVVEWRLAGTFSGAPFQGIDATGKHIELRGLDLFEVEDGHVVANTAYYDGLEFARQVGMMPARDSGAERAMKSAFNGTTKLRRLVDERIGS
jgi:steroid delta-isomerase-like uncharacterized protein